MLRELLIAFGLVEVVKPHPVVDACERIGLENPETAQLRPWALWGARVEGLLFVWVLVRGRNGTIGSVLLGAAGVVLVVAPRPLIRRSQDLVYENSAELELKPWIEPAARALCLCYLIVVALSRRVGAPDLDPQTDGAHDRSPQ